MISNIELRGGNAPWLEHAGKQAAAPAIHLSPANGLPIASYKSFIESFNGNYSFTGLDTRGAWSNIGEPQNDFRAQAYADDLIEAIEKTYSKPIIGMGHSHGALITAVAAIKRPDLFSRVVMIDIASMPTPLLGFLVPRMPKSWVMSWLPIVGGSYRRQRVWESKDAFYRRYVNHPTYRRFTQTAMRDYAEYGLKDRSDGQVELVYNPSWEAHIFRTVGFSWGYLSKLSVPSLLVRAQHSNICTTEQFQKYNKRLDPCVETLEIDDTHHLLTHEAPDKTASAIMSYLGS